MTDFITLGIGPGGDITHFICVGLSPGAAISEPAPAPAPLIGGGRALLPGRVRRTWKTERELPRPAVIVGVGEIVLTRPDVSGRGTVTPVVTGTAALSLAVALRARAALEVCGYATVSAGLGEVCVVAEIEDPYALARILDDVLVLQEIIEA